MIIFSTIFFYRTMNTIHLKSITMFIIIFSVILVFAIIFPIMEIKNKKVIKYDEESDFYSINSHLISETKKYCSNEITYCFEDSDCSIMCDLKNQYICINGICKNNKIITTVPENKCDPSKGMVGFLIGTPSFGKYDFICKSIDPGIALSVNTNLMCKGQNNMLIDYISKFPTTNQCLCINKSIVPATQNKRKHVECDDIYHQLVSRGL